jgi:citrate lyase beta subunit
MTSSPATGSAIAHPAQSHTAAADAPAAATGAIRHFPQLSPEAADELFFRAPQPFDGSADRERLAMALGATLYVPATRANLAEVIRRRAAQGVTSMVMDLEDAVADDEVEAGMEQVVRVLDELAAAGPAPMLLFVRVRDAHAIRWIGETVTVGMAALTGFVLPKFSAIPGADLLAEVQAASLRAGKRLYAMPILESVALVHRQTRDSELVAIVDILAQYREEILAVRIGGTDMSGEFGIRRDRDLTIYDVRIVADAIADIVNYLGRGDGTGFTITGPVWEYFADRERMYRPTLRMTPFAEHDAVRFRQHLVSRDLDGLLREIVLDRANGIFGKTVIHPSHVAPVHALAVVTHEEYHDALDIAGITAGGVRKSEYANKMNEAKPHRTWAQRTLLRADVFGVAGKGVSFVDVLAALVAR